MGMEAPSTPPPQGGVTIERSGIDPKITGAVQSQFSNQMTSLGNQMAALPGQMQYGSQFNPQNLNLQNRVNLNEARPFSYSQTLDPLIQSQLSQASQETAEALYAKQAQVAEQLRAAPGNNQALLASMQGDMSREAALQSNPYRLQALQQQQQMDTNKYGLNLQGAQLTNQARMSEGQFYNQSQIDARQAAQNAAQLNAAIMAQNNQTRVGALSPQMSYMSQLGQGMLSTAPRTAANMTMSDLEKLRQDGNQQNVLGQIGQIEGWMSNPNQANTSYNAPAYTQPMSKPIAYNNGSSGLGGVQQQIPQRRYWA